MNCKWIIGTGAFLDVAHDAWIRAFPDRRIEKITVTQTTQYRFDLASLVALDPNAGSVFVAFDERFGNFKRVELMQAVMAHGFRVVPFVSPRAILASDVTVGPNAFVGDGTIIGQGSRIGYNSVLLAGAQVGCGVDIRPSCWLEAGTIVGDGAKIGDQCTLRVGALVAPTVQIGRNCELGWPQRYGQDIAAKTFFDPRYCEPIHVYGK